MLDDENKTPSCNQWCRQQRDTMQKLEQFFNALALWEKKLEN